MSCMHVLIKKFRTFVCFVFKTGVFLWIQESKWKILGICVLPGVLKCPINHKSLSFYRLSQFLIFTIRVTLPNQLNIYQRHAAGCLIITEHTVYRHIAVVEDWNRIAFTRLTSMFLETTGRTIYTNTVGRSLQMNGLYNHVYQICGTHFRGAWLNSCR